MRKPSKGNKAGILERSLKKFEKELEKLEKSVELFGEVKREAEIDFLLKKIKESLLKGETGWMKEREREIAKDLWDAFSKGLINEGIFEKGLKELARRMVEFGRE